MLWYGTDLLHASELLGYFVFAKQQVVMYEGQECKYRSGSSEAGSSQVICGLIGLNCVRRVFELEEQHALGDLEDKDENFLQELISPETIQVSCTVSLWDFGSILRYTSQGVTSIDDTLKPYSNLSVGDLLERPQFQNAFAQAVVSHEHLSYEGFIALFESVSAGLITLFFAQILFYNQSIWNIRTNRSTCGRSDYMSSRYYCLHQALPSGFLQIFYLRPTQAA